jgi:hypothetical protein
MYCHTTSGNASRAAPDVVVIRREVAQPDDDANAQPRQACPRWHGSADVSRLGHGFEVFWAAIREAVSDEAEDS